jgi:hypothetical protein
MMQQRLTASTMKGKTMKVLLFAAVTLAGSARLALADMPGADWMTKEQVTKTLSDRGYTNVNKLEADDGHWEGNAMKDGQMVEIHVDPHTGAITKSEPDN